MPEPTAPVAPKTAADPVVKPAAKNSAKLIPGVPTVTGPKWANDHEPDRVGVEDGEASSARRSPPTPIVNKD